MRDWILKESAVLFDVNPYNITFTYNIIKLVHLLLLITRKYTIIRVKRRPMVRRYIH